MSGSRISESGDFFIDWIIIRAKNTYFGEKENLIFCFPLDISAFFVKMECICTLLSTFGMHTLFPLSQKDMVKTGEHSGTNTIPMIHSLTSYSTHRFQNQRGISRSPSDHSDGGREKNFSLIKGMRCFDVSIFHLMNPTANKYQH